MLVGGTPRVVCPDETGTTSVIIRVSNPMTMREDRACVYLLRCPRIAAHRVLDGRIASARCSDLWAHLAAVPDPRDRRGLRTHS